MNPLTNIRNVQKLNERELELGIIGKKSWHDDYKDSAWIFIGGLPFDLSEGDIICVFSQYGEVVNFNLIRDHKTGKSKGFAFLCFEDQRSTVLSVDNLNGIKILSRTVRVDHVKDYKVPKDHDDDDELVRKLRDDGCAPNIEDAPPGEQSEEGVLQKTKKKRKKGKKKIKKEKMASKQSSHSSSGSDSEGRTQQTKVTTEPVEVKKEKDDQGYVTGLGSSHQTLHNSSRRRPEERDNGYFPRNDSRHGSSQRHSDDEGEDHNHSKSKIRKRVDSSPQRSFGQRDPKRDFERSDSSSTYSKHRDSHSGRDERRNEKYGGSGGGNNRDKQWDDRERSRDRSKERQRDDRERQRDRSKERQGDHRERQRDRSKERQRDDRERQRDRDRSKDRDNEHQRDRSSGKDKYR